jgi:hypothetical protein
VSSFGDLTNHPPGPILEACKFLQYTSPGGQGSPPPLYAGPDRPVADERERRRQSGPGRWESWVQIAAVLVTMFGAVWQFRGTMDRIATNQETFLAHLCRIEVKLSLAGSAGQCAALMGLGSQP